MCQVDITFFCPTKSEMNIREKAKYKMLRHKRQKITVWALLNNTLEKPITTPCVIKLTRFGHSKMDFDNLVCCFKRIRDAVAERIHPDLPPGRADDDPNIEWQYLQVVDRKMKDSIRIEIV